FMRQRHGWDDEALGQELTQLLPGISESELESVVQRAIAAGEPASWLQACHVSVTGEELVSNFCVYPLHAGSQVTGAVLVIEDVTAQIQAQMREQRQARILATINEIGHQAATTLDVERLARTATQALVDQLGYEGALIAAREGDEMVWLGWAGVYERLGYTSYHKRIEPDQGITDWVLYHGETVLANDARRDPRFRDCLSETQSELCVPIKHNDVVIGFINVESKRLGAFQPEDQVALETLADQLVTAVQNARLHAETKARAEELKAVYDAGLALGSATDLDQMLFALASSAARICNADGGASFVLYDPTEHRFDRSVSIGAHGEEMKAKPSSARPDGLTARILRSGKPYFQPDLLSEPALNPRVREVGYRSTIAVPLLGRDHPLGVLYVSSFHPHAFQRADVRRLQLLASQAAIVVENARLYEEARRQAEKLERAYRELQELDKLKDHF
ncbi:MAG TPA: GAF domain-containing protein, partial [Anaerolineae bacterium]|nr:GAF domain-containing protein [Anaerolineae bacterium]